MAWCPTSPSLWSPLFGILGEGCYPGLRGVPEAPILHSLCFNLVACG